MRRFAADKRMLRLSIPIKVVVVTGLAYVAVWGLGLLVERVAGADILGIGLRQLWLGVEILAVAAAATVGTHLFLDRPLVRLMRVMRRAEEGDFLVRAPVLSGDEVGELARAFNRMLSSITDLAATKIQSENDLLMAQQQLAFRRSLEEKNAVIERTNHTLAQRLQDLELIHEIGQEVTSIIDLEKLYATITETLRRHLRVQECAILVFDEKREELHVRAAFGFPDPDAIFKTTFRTGEGITGLVAETGRKIYIRDTSREERFLHYKGEGPRTPSSFLSVPLSSKGEVLGVVNFARPGPGSFTSTDVKMMSLVAGQVALAIANARLYTRTRELSVRDELIGINNRRHFQQMLQMEWKRAVRFRRQLSLIMIDIDHFKEYNDSFGHLQGDQALKQIGALLKKNLREVDTVARFGGEEFVLLLPDTDKRGAQVVAEKVRAVAAAHRFLTEEGQETRRVTISAGVATYPDDVGEQEDLIDQADIALYRAKENGRNRVECAEPLAREEEMPAPAGEIAPRRREVKKPETVQ